MKSIARLILIVWLLFLIGSSLQAANLCHQLSQKTTPEELFTVLYELEKQAESTHSQVENILYDQPFVKNQLKDYVQELRDQFFKYLDLDRPLDVKEQAELRTSEARLYEVQNLLANSNTLMSFEGPSIVIKVMQGELHQISSPWLKKSLTLSLEAELSRLQTFVYETLRNNPSRLLKLTESGTLTRMRKRLQIWQDIAEFQHPIVYENPGHHDPNSSSFRGGGSMTTALPKNAKELFNRAIPEEANTWWTFDGTHYHRFQGAVNGEKMVLHWNGTTEGGRAIANRDIPMFIKDFFQAK